MVRKYPLQSINAHMVMQHVSQDVPIVSSYPGVPAIVERVCRKTGELA